MAHGYHPEVMHGRQAVRGMRIRVAGVLSLLAAGATEADILADYLFLEADDLRARLGYAAAQVGHAVIAAEPSSARAR